jgi:starvation-inducible DNA-binding protein
MKEDDIATQRMKSLKTPTTLSANAVQDMPGSLTTLLADMFALFIKTKNFHWHVFGPRFHDYHLLLDEQRRRQYQLDFQRGRYRAWDAIHALRR